jgi:hypothetical protein
MRKIELSVRYDIRNILLNNEHIIDCCLDKNGDVVILVLLNKPDFQVEKGLGIFPKVESEAKNKYKIYRISKDYQTEISISSTRMNFHFIRCIDRDNYLLACSRSRYFDNGKYDLNAHIYDELGNKVRQFLIGDGIQDIKISSDNTIWTSYFDEGVFGNLGWDSPIGESGLRAWDIYGNDVYRYSPLNSDNFIVDCYALNTVGNEVWFYFYTEFFLARISEVREIDYWKPNLEGVSTLLVYRNFILMDGGYSNTSKYHLYKLYDNKLKVVDKLNFIDEFGKVLEKPIYFNGYNAVFLNENKIYIADLREFCKD